MIKNVIFDFDGTIADTEALFVTVANKLAPQFGFPVTPQEELDKMKDLSMREMFQQMHIPFFTIPFIIQAGRKGMADGVKTAITFPGMTDVLTKLKDRGLRLFILSSNSTENINVFLQNNKLSMFEGVHSGLNVFGKDAAIKKLLKKYSLNLAECIYVGDELRDIEACRKIQMPIISVAWGYNSEAALNRANPGYLISSPEELLTKTL